MKPTRISLLVALVVVAGASAYLLTRAYYADLPSPTAYWPVTLVLLATLELVTARTTRARLDGRPHTRPIDPIAVARLAAFAKSTSPVAAVLTGGWAGFLVHVVRVAGPQASRDTVTGAFGVGASLLLVVAALVLERTCRVRKPRG